MKQIASVSDYGQDLDHPVTALICLDNICIIRREDIRQSDYYEISFGSSDRVLVTKEEFVQISALLQREC